MRVGNEPPSSQVIIAFAVTTTEETSEYAFDAYGLALAALTVMSPAWASPPHSDESNLTAKRSTSAAAWSAIGDEGHGAGKTARELKVKARDYTPERSSVAAIPV